MLFTWKLLKKIIPVLPLIIFVLVIFSFRDAVKSRVEPWLSVLPWWESEEDEIDSDDGENSTEVDDRERDTRPLKVVTANSSIEVLVEDARTSKDREIGLMYREELCEDCGMIFIFDSDVSGGFWMRNCEISLDLIFIDSSGRIVDIKKEFEPCIEDPCPIYRPDKNYRYVLEVNDGWTSKHEVSIGDSVENI